MAQNRDKINAKRLFDLLESISKFVDRKTRMYALGGTALTILNIKNSTLDIDINIDTDKEYEYVKEIFGQVGFEKISSIRWITREGLIFDVFHGSNILGTDLLSDCLKKSKFIKAFGNIELYTLSLQDIIISKLARGEDRDFEDIKAILKKEKIDLKGLVDRYKKTMEVSTVSMYKQRLLDLIEIKFKEWGFKLNHELIGEVRKWQHPLKKN